ncbi:unnamed protein product [Somion occarium]|uniref:DUF2415 domain-containing protein n=2 Tax=Somion occarium TaxID=3059160 RepID=A0ABP1EEE7_9APHY
MARGGPSTLLTSMNPSTVSKARVTIGHIQLRDVLICPHERGVVYYPQEQSIVEHDMTAPSPQTRQIVDLPFVPNSLSSLALSSEETLLAAGGQEAELHLSLYSPPSPSYPSEDEPREARRFGRQRWKMDTVLEQASINNSVYLPNLNLCGSNESSFEPRIMISNNDRTVKFFDISLRGKNHSMDGKSSRLSSAGELHLDVPVNHSSISPDGRTLLSVGDSPDVYLHRISGGARLAFSPINKLSLSPYIGTTSSYSYNPHIPYSSSAVPASFSTAFSANGSKFAVASQEGVVVVWDVRSTKPLKVIQTDKTRTNTRQRGNGSNTASGWLFESPWDWARNSNNAPGWGVRSVKFSPAGTGQEIMTFTEHTSLVHMMDARTFETHEIVRIPNFDTPQSTRPPTARPRSSSPPARSSPSLSSSTVEPQSLPQPARILLFSGAVEDTFRIPLDVEGIRNTNARRRIRRRRDDSSGADDDLDGRPVRSRISLLPGSSSGSHDDSERELEGEDRVDEDMDVDELEACLSSHTPSRAPSPAPPNTASASTSSYTPFQAPATSAIRMSQAFEHLRSPRPSTLARRESSGPYIPRRPSSHIRRLHRRNQNVSESTNNNEPADVEQDIAGICFDPTGQHIYAAATKGISEWTVRGAEKSWWIDSSWA